MLLRLALYFSCGATACYLWGRRIKGRADNFDSITRVKDIKGLDDLLKEKAANLLVVVSGRVGSATPFKGKHNGPVALEQMFELNFGHKLEDVPGLIKTSANYNFLFERKKTSWYLEDNSGQVNVASAEHATGFSDILNLQGNIFDLFMKFFEGEEASKMPHIYAGVTLDIGTPLTFVGEAIRDEAGNVMIQKHKDHSLLVFKEGSFDEMMLGLTIYPLCGATACYLWGRRIKGRADDLNSITRVRDLQWLDNLLKEKAADLLVVVSGRVGSRAPFKSKHNGRVVFEEKLELDIGQKTVNVPGLFKTSANYNFLFQKKDTPWYLEDGTGRVNVVRPQDAEGFHQILKEHDINMPVIFFGLLGKLFNPGEASKVPHSYAGSTLDIGTPLTIVGEAGRDKGGKLTIKKPKEHSFLVFNEGSFDKTVADLTSNSEVYISLSKSFGGIAVAMAIMYGVDYVRRRKRNNNLP